MKRRPQQALRVPAERPIYLRIAAPTSARQWKSGWTSCIIIYMRGARLSRRASPQITGQARFDHLGLSPATPVLVSSYVWPRERTPQVHMHAGYELGVLLAGRQQRWFDGLDYVAGPGDLWLAAGWEPHGWQCLEADTSDVVVQWLPEFLGDETLAGLPWVQVFGAPAASRPRVTGGRLRESVLAVGREIQSEFRREEPGWGHMVRLDLLRLLILLTRGWMPPDSAHPRFRLRSDDLSRIMPALDLVNADLAHRASVTQAAAACQLGRAQFCTIFRRTLGMSFGTYSRLARLSLASELLVSTSLPIEAVAAMTGFTDGSHLHRVFVQYYGLSPGDHRDQESVLRPLAPAEHPRTERRPLALDLRRQKKAP
jgi:AraC-like DNA-binding protein/quercetin dioxygenase-like cupin family protein